MKAAVYYPYLRVRTHGLMKHALLFWDHLEIITPFSYVERPDDTLLAEATEFLVKPCNPTEAQKDEAHVQLMSLVSKPLPHWFYLDARQPSDPIYAQKFLHRTWLELRERGLASIQDGDEEVFWSSGAFSLLMMSVLADCCAGQVKVMATDQPDAHYTLGNCLAVEAGAKTAPAHEGDRALVSTEVLSPSLEEISLADLIALRKREAGTNGYQYRQLRHNLFAKIAGFSESLSMPSYNEADRVELCRQFKDELNADTADLRNELGMAGRGWVVSTEMMAFIATIVGAGVKGVAGDFSGSLMALGAGIPLVRGTDKYKAARFKALSGHFSSYLYLAKHSRFERDI